MTRDSMPDSPDMATSAAKPKSYRRKTMGAGDVRELLSAQAPEPHHMRANVAKLRNIDNYTPPMAANNSTRRMSIGGGSAMFELDNNDWEQPRLDIEGFVVDYFTYRICKDGLEWFDSPSLPYGTQPEHEMMRTMGSIFEEKNRAELETVTEQLLSSPKVTYSVYQEIVKQVGSSTRDPCPMSYSRLIGLLAFGGIVAAKMMSNVDLRSQVSQMTMYTSLFIKSRLRSSWKEYKRNWADFMTTCQPMRQKYEGKMVCNPKPIESKWPSLNMVTTVGAVVGLAFAVGGRLIYNLIQ